MENLKVLSFPALKITRVLAALGTMFVLSACGNGGGGGGSTPAPVTPVNILPTGLQGCGNCSAITNPVVMATFNSQAFDGSVVLQDMQVYGQSTSSSPYGYYNGGPIALQGKLVVSKATYDVSTYYPGSVLSSCVLQPGTYYVQTASVGQMDAYGQIYVPSLKTTSGSIEMSVEGMLYQNNTRGYVEFAVTRVNGVTCSNQFYGVFN